MPRQAPRSAPRSGMTLLELLGVILVCFILWAFLFPAAEGILRTSRRRQAAADVHALANAVLAYHLEYGSFPCQENRWDEDILYATDSVSSSASLRQVDIEDLLHAPSATNSVDTPRCIPFLADGPARIRDGAPIDPWGSPYVVVADGNADGWIGSSDSHVVSAFSVSSHTNGVERTHHVPAARIGAYAFAWGDSDDTSVASLEGRE